MLLSQAAITPIAQATKMPGQTHIQQVAANSRLDSQNQQFSGAMARAAQPGAAIQPVQLAQNQLPASAAPPGPVTAAPSADAAERARRTLGLDAATAAPSGGDSILNGLQKLRSVFDQQQSRLNTVMAAPATDPKTLLNLQMELVNFTILVDVSSKLTGKSTQALETLLKGQ